MIPFEFFNLSQAQPNLTTHAVTQYNEVELVLFNPLVFNDSEFKIM